MNWRNVRLIFLRELRDQLRDRRTLFMIAVLPLLLYPALGVGVVQMAITVSEQPRTVVVLGEGELPEPAFLVDGGIAPEWLDDPQTASRLTIISEGGRNRVPGEAKSVVVERLDAAERIRDSVREGERLKEAGRVARSNGNDVEATGLDARLAENEREQSRLFAESGIQVLMIVPDGMREKLAEVDRRIRRRDASAANVEVPKPAFFHNQTDEKAIVAFSRVIRAYDRWKEHLLRDRLRMAALPETLTTQLDARTVDFAREEERSRTLWSKLFPALLVIMTLTGAFYPAVDLAAGEKERGTMETLLICPASRAEIVLGKFFTVMAFSICTALLNLASMGFTGKYMAAFALGGAMAKGAALAPPPLGSIVWVVLLLVPLAALFSALCLALATFARSSKEGQYHLTPLLLVTIGLTVFCLMPTVEITPLYSVAPVIGVSLLLKELLAGAGGYVYIVPVLATSFGYAAMALWWAIEQFNREDVLFREAERFELKLWLRHLLRDKGDRPSFAEAGFCFVLIMLMQFGAMKVLAESAGLSADITNDERAVRMLKLLMVQQLVIIATPALLMGVMLTRSVKETFRLRLPPARYFVIAVLLPLALQPLCHTLLRSLEWFFPAPPESAVEAVRLMGSANISVWLALLAFAVAPAVCEEIAFRGFILSGFLSSRRTWFAIGLSSVAFGIMHMIPQQVFNAALVGIVLGLLAVRSGSLWPGVVFHFLFNSSQVLLSRIDGDALSRSPWRWLATVEDGRLDYSWWLLGICAFAAFAMIRRLGGCPPAERAERRRFPRGDSPAVSGEATLTAV